jgi:hypothetical protein
MAAFGGGAAWAGMLPRQAGSYPRRPCGGRGDADQNRRLETRSRRPATAPAGSRPHVCLRRHPSRGRAHLRRVTSGRQRVVPAVAPWRRAGPTRRRADRPPPAAVSSGAGRRRPGPAAWPASVRVRHPAVDPAPRRGGDRAARRCPLPSWPCVAPAAPARLDRAAAHPPRPRAR